MLVNIYENEKVQSTPDLVTKTKNVISKINIFNPPDEFLHTFSADSDSSSFSSSDSEPDIPRPKEIIKIPKYKEVTSTQLVTKKFIKEYRSGYLGYINI